MADLASAQAANADTTTQPEDFSADPFWGYVSKHKFAEFNLCTLTTDENKQEKYIVDTNQPTIRAFLTDGDINFESQWQTPFENSNPELRMPMLVAGLQTGQTVEQIGRMAGNLGDRWKPVKVAADAIGAAISPLSNFMESVQGKTNLNKINTTQVFLSTASVHLNLSIFFIALNDARKEVEEKLMYLESWTLPQYLSDQTVLTDVSQAVKEGGWSNAPQGLFSGRIPPFVCVSTHGKTYMPFILQSISAPIVAPIDEAGNRLSLAVTLSLISKAAWDAQDVRNLYNYKV